MQGDNTLPYRSYPDLLKFSFACEGRFPRGPPRGTLSRMSIRGRQVQGDNTLPYLSPRPKEVWYLFEGPPIAPWPDTVGCWWSWCRSWGNECKAIRPYPVCYPVPYYTCERESELTRCEFHGTVSAEPGQWNCIGGAGTVEMEPASGCVR